ncbi:hypothetical protein VPH35_007216 [Triticum aestivum]
MDRSHGSSNEALSSQKRRWEGSVEGEVHLEYKAALRSKLQADHARAEGATVELGGPSSLDSGSAAAGPSALHGGSSSCPSDPWEVAAAESKAGSADPISRPGRRRGPQPGPREDGHLTVDCQNCLKPPAFVHYDLGLPGYAFFALDSEVPQVIPIPALSNAGIMTVKNKKISPQVLLNELQLWDDGGWDWQIHQLSEFEFAVIFPSKESLRVISSCTSFTLPLNQLVVSVKAAFNGSKAISHLSDVWILVDDVPPMLRSPTFLMAFDVLIGKPIEVDPASLLVLGPS